MIDSEKECGNDVQTEGTLAADAEHVMNEEGAGQKDMSGQVDVFESWVASGIEEDMAKHMKGEDKQQWEAEKKLEQNGGNEKDQEDGGKGAIEDCNREGEDKEEEKLAQQEKDLNQDTKEDKEGRGRQEWKHRSRSRSRGERRRRSRSRSRSRSVPRRRRRRKTLFDVLPELGSQALEVPALFGENILPDATIYQPAFQRTTRKGKRVFVGGLMPTGNEQSTTNCTDDCSGCLCCSGGLCCLLGA